MPILRAHWHVGVILLAVLIGWLAPARAQTEHLHTIQIGSHELAVGMEESVIISRLADDFSLSKVSPTDLEESASKALFE